MTHFFLRGSASLDNLAKCWQWSKGFCNFDHISGFSVTR